VLTKSQSGRVDSNAAGSGKDIKNQRRSTYQKRILVATSRSLFLSLSRFAIARFDDIRSVMTPSFQLNTIQQHWFRADRSPRPPAEPEEEISSVEMHPARDPFQPEC